MALKSPESYIVRASDNTVSVRHSEEKMTGRKEIAEDVAEVRGLFFGCRRSELVGTGAERNHRGAMGKVFSARSDQKNVVRSTSTVHLSSRTQSLAIQFTVREPFRCGQTDLPRRRGQPGAKLFIP